MTVYPPPSTSGIVTLGTGAGESLGDVNVSDAGMNGDIGKALTAAALRGKIIYILPGAYTAKTAATISAVGVQVIGIGTPTIEVPTTNTSSVAVLNIESLNGVRVTGLSISWSAFVASQIMVNCSPATGTVQVATEIVGNTFTANNDVATGFVGGTNEMIAVNVEDGSEVLVADNRFYPSLGLTCIKATDGYGTVVKDNVISNVTNTFFPDITDLQRRPMWRGIHMQDETGFTLDSNKIRNCGMIAFGTTYEIDSAIYIDNADVAKTTEELGHVIVQDNRIENCQSSTNCLMVMRGVRWGNVNGNWFCFNGIAATKGTGFLKIEGATGATGEVSYKISVTGNHFHNPGTAAAAAIYLRNCQNVSIKANDFFELQSAQAIYLDNSAGTGAAMKCIAVIANEFEWFSNSPTTRNVVLRDGTTTALENYAAMANVAYSGSSAEVVDGFYSGTAPTGVYTTTKGVMDSSTGIDVATSADTANLRTNIIMITS